MEPDPREGRRARGARGGVGGEPRRRRPPRGRAHHDRRRSGGPPGRDRWPRRHRRRRRLIDHGDRDVDGRAGGRSMARIRLAVGDRAPRCPGAREPVGGRGGHAAGLRGRSGAARRAMDAAALRPRLPHPRRAPRARAPRPSWSPTRPCSARSRCSARSWRSPTGSVSLETSPSKCWPRHRSPAPPSGAAPSIEEGDYPRRFALALARKDSELIIEAAREAGVDVRLLEAARAWLADAEEAGFGDRDYSTVLAKIIETD